MPSIHVINPAGSVPGYYTGEAFSDADGGWTQIADLSIPTVAALVPAGWDVHLTDECISPVDLDGAGDFIALTGKVTQRARMIELADAFRRQGRTVLVGGSYASLDPAAVRPHADVLVTGELEQLAPALFADLASSRWADLYDGGRADIRASPLPRWDLYPTHRASSGALQTTRGCPFNCEFCDVIQYQGRTQRHKDLPQILDELTALYECGFRDVFIADDNFTVHRSWARGVLDALADWNQQRGHSVRFLTQASIDVARDPDLLARLRAAGVRTLFVGVETINASSLRETRKHQNLLLPMRDAIARIVEQGIMVLAGVIVGFDHDEPSIFSELLDFFQDSPLPNLSIGVLTAPTSTDLHRRLEAEGRLQGEDSTASAGSPFTTNIRPARMTQGALLEGTIALARELYAPDRYRQRVLNLLECYGKASPAPPVVGQVETRSGRAQALRVFQRLADRGDAEAAMASDLLRRAAPYPSLLGNVVGCLVGYEQARVVLDHARSFA